MNGHLDEVPHAGGGTRENNHAHAPLMGALVGKHEDLAVYLLDLPGQEFNLQPR